MSQKSEEGLERNGEIQNIKIFGTEPGPALFEEFGAFLFTVEPKNGMKFLQKGVIFV